MRVLTVADIYEALTADRPYRAPLAVEAALAIIDRDVPRQLDAEVRDALRIHVGRVESRADRIDSTLSRAA
jgi:HD-GYP domain-containing protein (c-di-GMP phosphodiesterase class II)